MFRIKKISMFILSISMIFAMTAPNFASAMKRPLVVPANLIYIRDGEKFSESYGTIIDENSEDPQWQIGECQIEAILRVNGKRVDQCEIPVDSFAFVPECQPNGKETAGKYVIMCTESLKDCLRANAESTLNHYFCEEAILEIDSRLLGKVDGIWHNVEERLAEIIIKNKANMEELQVPSHKKRDYLQILESHGENSMTATEDMDDTKGIFMPVQY